METSRRLRHDQQGFAAIVVALVIILVLSLMTVGFAQLMRNEQRSALDKQLSSQAYYAAESGVNQAVAAINAGYFQTNQPKAACGTIANDTFFSKNTVGTNTGASYPCLLVNPTPSSLQYSTISTTVPEVVELEGIDPVSGNPASISTLQFSWQDANGNKAFPSGCSSFQPYGVSGWTYTGLLKTELIALNDTSGNPAFDRTSLTNHAATAFLCPNNDSTAGQTCSHTYSSDIGTSSGALINGQCNTGNVSLPTPLYCNAQITNLSVLNESTFFLVMRSIYNPVTVTITAYNGSTRLNIGDAQVLVDSTGKAQDVLRRVQVRVPVHNNYNLTDGVDAATSLCKQLQLTPTSSNNSSTGCPVAP